MAISCFYGASSGSGRFEIRDGKILMFATTYYIDFSNHEFSSMKTNQLITCRYNTQEELAAVVALSIITAKNACNNANTYLDDHGLPYVF